MDIQIKVLPKYKILVAWHIFFFFYERYLYKDRRLDTTAGEKVENARVVDEKKLQ